MDFGEIIEGHKVLARLGQGAFGVVYKVEDLNNEM